MSDEAPPRALTIRVGDTVFTDVRDYIILVRQSDNGIASHTSSVCWADGAMKKVRAEIEVNNFRDASKDEDSE